MADENEITQSRRAVVEDTQAHEPIVPGGPPAPPPGPPPRWYADAWPWLAALGILALAGLIVWLFVLRDRSNGRVVPAVVGLQQQQAIAKLTGEGFGVRAIIGPSAKPRGIVFAQTPGGGSQLDKGQTVQIDVSNGLGGKTSSTTTTTSTSTTTTAPTTTAPASTVAVPDVGGQTAADGAGQVEAAGLIAETLPVAEAGTAGTIVAQDPGPGSQAPAGSTVHLSVATGSNRPAAQVPDVTGQTAAAARAALLDAHLTVKTAYKNGKRGVVLSQSPSSGSSQPAWTQVTITVGG